MTSIDRTRVVAFRLAAHHLDQRLPRPSLLEAARPCGLQNSPPGSASLSLHARVAQLTPAVIAASLQDDRTLLLIWCMRASPYLVPTADAGVFTYGMLPEDEASRRFFIRGAERHLGLFGLSATKAVDLTAAVLPEVLDGRALTKDEMGVAVAQRLSPRFQGEQADLWETPDGLGTNTHGETLVRFAFSIVALQGLFCISPQGEGATRFIRTDQWLGRPLPRMDHREAEAELARRYLHCYGPSTTSHFAQWAGISPDQASRAWGRLEHELEEVSLGRRRAWLLAEDMPRLTDPPPPEGVRLLPPHDPYLQLRDREILIPDKALHRRVWRAAGNPGVVLVGGQPVGLWRPRKRAQHLGLEVELWEPTSSEARAQIEAEAASLAPFRDCTSVEVRFSEGAGG